MKRNKAFAGEEMHNQKRFKLSPHSTGISRNDYFDSLPDDLVISILCKLSSTADSPADFASVLLTCKRLNGLGLDSIVLYRASQKTFAVGAKNWPESAHRFLKQCSDAGNVEASYTLGMWDMNYDESVDMAKWRAVGHLLMPSSMGVVSIQLNF